jgi:hypothetical protein
MKTSVTRLVVTCIVTGGLLLSASLQAKKIEFPEKDPAISFDVPDGWTSETGPDGRMYFTAPDGFKFGIVASPGVKTAEDAKGLVPTILKSMCDAMKCEGYKMEDPHTADVGKMWLTAGEAHGKVDGNEMSLNAVVFSLSPGKYFSIVGAATKAIDEAHGKDMNAVLKSIAAVD